MKKLIAFLVIVILIAFFSLNIAPQLYLKYTTEQYLAQAKERLAGGDIETGIEKLRIAVFTAGKSPLLKNAAMSRAPDMLLDAAGKNPFHANEILTFAARNGIEFPCDVRRGIFSSLMESTYPIFFRKSAGNETAAKVAKIEVNLKAAAEWARGCELDPDVNKRFSAFKRAWEKLSGRPFVEAPMFQASAIEPDEPLPQSAAPAPNPLASVMAAPGSFVNSIKNLIASRFHKPVPGGIAGQPAPPSAASAPPYLLLVPSETPPAPNAPAQPTAQPSPAPQQPPPPAARPAREPSAAPPHPAWLDPLASALDKVGIKALGADLPDNRTLYLAIESSNAGSTLITEIKTVFEIVDAAVSVAGLLDEIVWLDLDIMAPGNIKKAGWHVTMDDYRLYRLKKITGKEFMERMKPN